MLRPKIEVLDDQLLDQILDEGYQLLMDPGVRVHNEEALALLAQAGASVDFEARIARIPREVIDLALETVPHQFDLYDLDGYPVVHYGGDQVHFDPGSTAVTLLEGDNGNQRLPVTPDFIRFVKLVETLPAYDAQSTAFVCRDVPEGIGDLYRLYLALLYMRKPIITGAFGKKTWWTMWEMLVAVAGGEAELEARPIAVFDVCPSPPLLWSDFTCQNLIDCARKGVPAQLVAMPLAGATSPVTIAAATIQHTAESLSGLAIHQLARAGSPLVWGGAPAAFDMREGTTPMGDVATWLIDCAYLQVGKHFGFPTHTYMGSSDAKILDIQCGLESAGGSLLAALAGANMISGAGMIDFLRCQSFEKLVVDAEIISMAKRLVAGIEARHTPIALDLMRRAAHRADHLASAHTHKWFRKELNIPSEVIDRGSWEAWQKKDRLTAVERSRRRINQLLTTYRLSPLEGKLKAELRAITQSAASKWGMEQLPDLPEDKDTTRRLNE